MNKKFTFMVAALLAAGSLFSTADAQTTKKPLNLTTIATNSADLNNWYYIALSADQSYYLVGDEIVNTDATEGSTVKGKKFTSLKAVGEADLEV